MFAAAVAAALIVAGCATRSTSIACAPVEHPELQGGSHLVAGTEPPVPYSSTPGTSGWHAAGRPPSGVFVDEGLSEPDIVAALEAGEVVVAYDAGAVEEQDVDRLERLADELAGRLTVTRFDDDMGAPVVLNAWATRQPCTGVDEEAIRQFVARFGDGGEGHG